MPRDLDEAEVDLAEDLTAAVVDRRQAVGRVLAQAAQARPDLAPGLPQGAPVVRRRRDRQGDRVGAGFSLESEGQALSNGIEGQPARVRTEGGRVVTGQPTGERRLELSL